MTIDKAKTRKERSFGYRVLLRVEGNDGGEVDVRVKPAAKRVIIPTLAACLALKCPGMTGAQRNHCEIRLCHNARK